MIKRIKDYFALRKLYKNSLRLLVIRSASAAAALKNAAELLEKNLDPETLKRLLGEEE